MKQIRLQLCGQSEERKTTAAGRGHRWSFFPDLFYFTVSDNPRYLAGYSNYEHHRVSAPYNLLFGDVVPAAGVGYSSVLT